MKRRIERIQDKDEKVSEGFRVVVKDGGHSGDFITIAGDEIVTLIVKEIRERSITPTTFSAREFISNFDDQWFKEYYEYNDNQVIRYGINHLSTQIMEALSAERMPIVDISISAESTAKSSSKYTKDDASLIQLSILENTLLNKACSYLLNTESVKAILVDIFVRVNGGPNNGAIKLSAAVPEIHTVVLYQNPTITPLEFAEGKGSEEILPTLHEITVIDPSNFIFSSHLSNFTQSVIDYAGNPISFTINTIHKTLPIYRPGTKDIGPACDQYRDCIDLAVKIALGLNQTSVSLQLLTYEDIKTCNIIQNLSNNPVIDSSIIRSETSLRIKQSSDIKILEVFNLAERLIAKTFVLMKKIFLNEDYNDAINKAVQILDAATSDVVKVESLLNINAEYIDSVHAFLVEQHSALLGEHNNVKEYIDGVLI